MAGGIRHTALFEEHISIGAKMAPAANWSLPQYYVDGTAAEHLHTRKGASIFDRCPDGEIRLAGQGINDTLLSMIPRLPETGSCCRMTLCNDSGAVVGDGTLCRMAEEDYFLVTHGGDPARIRDVLAARLPDDAVCDDLSDFLAGILLAGPAAESVLRELLEEENAPLPPVNGCGSIQVEDLRCVVCCTSFTGEREFLLLFNQEFAADFWELLMETDPVRPAGTAAFHSLRLEAGVPAFGAEIPCVPQKILTGIVLETRRAAAAGSDVLSADGTMLGKVTTGAFAPTLGKAAALAYLPELPAGTPVVLHTIKGDLAGTTAALPLIELP